MKSLFTEDIAAFLDTNEIRYSENISIIGKSKLPCQFDFVIPKSKDAPERLIKGVNSLDNNAAKLLIFSWEDTREVRKSESKLITFINDTNRAIASSALASLNEYNITPVIWTERESAVIRLTA